MRAIPSYLFAAGVDYRSEFVMRDFTNSTRRVCLTVLTFLDGLEELPETFSVILSGSDPAIVIGLSVSTGTILDGDCKY